MIKDFNYLHKLTYILIYLFGSIHQLLILIIANTAFLIIYLYL